MLGNLVYLYLLSPLHTGGTTQEGNLLGIARESHTNLPYIPSSTIRGKLRSLTPEVERNRLWGNTIDDVTGSSSDTNLTQGSLWIGDASILWLPVPSLSHGVVWVSSPMLLQRWARLNGRTEKAPEPYSNNFAQGKPVYLKDAILKSASLKPKSDLKTWIPQSEIGSIDHALILPDQHCTTLIQMSLWRQVKVKLDEHKTVNGGFRYEEAIPPDTLMYFPWGVTSQATGQAQDLQKKFNQILTDNAVMQIGGQESLGRGFVQQWSSEAGVKQEATV
ncbi:type III-B CRISPR module RAMP protein Cmr4 [Leptolyngbya sp. 'hensonii']|uniref:type III-B CRISPR module RAMP protein Cmr4 n=1 Tax=Leptolyngbya sp. 'hensonii' TaxID=1922337 RepID=UPI0009502ED0|nr:type III-B CRISPR module RAMP protein Cmr4 [Leptolyngbya sp. 'hensonii']OLP17435.1 type III-B CRISPR module RAMP protein Cmr4 [Leptolyngbya sp. 'hensonii']